MPRTADEILRDARDQLYHAKTLTRSLRNTSKTIAAALDDREAAIDELLAEIETVMQEPHAKEAQGHEHEEQAARNGHAAVAR